MSMDKAAMSGGKGGAETADRLRERVLNANAVERMPPSRWPTRAALEGASCVLEPVDPDRHAAMLYEGSHGSPAIDALWTYMPYGPFANAGAFRVWLGDCASGADPLFYTIVDRASGRFVGMASYLNIYPKNGSIEIGHIWFSPSVQRTRLTTESLYLMMRHAMDDLGYRRLEWKCNALNEPSRAAARRLGFRYEGIFYNHLVVKGRNRDTAWYSILDDEWPQVRATFERWLAPQNFDSRGQQIHALSALAAARSATH
ncbi:MAG: GNAT family protein [Rhodospirillaceae bacterium]|nr:GNAT family protein [Rhodospirillaceae bacterium]